MKKSFLVGMLAMVLAFGFVLVGCKGDDDNPGILPGSGGGQLANSISGTTWVYDNSPIGKMTLEFRETGSGKYTSDDYESESQSTGDFTYTYADSKGTFSPDTWKEEEVKSSAFSVDTTAKTLQLTKAFIADNPAIYKLVE